MMELNRQKKQFQCSGISKSHFHSKEPVEAGNGTRRSHKKIYIRALANGTGEVDWKE